MKALKEARYYLAATNLDEENMFMLIAKFKERKQKLIEETVVECNTYTWRASENHKNSEVTKIPVHSDLLNFHHGFAIKECKFTDESEHSIMFQ